MNRSIVIDGVFFQLANTGIARVWREVLTRWQDMDIGRRVVVMDRRSTLPRFEKLRTVPCPAFDHRTWEGDRAIAQEICESYDADLFVSTYYTRPLHTPSILLVHDMIPERLGMELSGPIMRQKADAIRHAIAFAAVSENTLADLRDLFPEMRAKSAIVAYPGVSPDFFPSDPEERGLFDARIRSQLGGRPYFLFVGGTIRYKNAGLFIRALLGMPPSELAKIGVVTTSPGMHMNDVRMKGAKVCARRLSDRGLRAAYSCAIALVYPSLYEGFGLPLLEAMACGCPVIGANNSSFPEVAGDAALLVDASSEEDLRAALTRVQDPATREQLRQRGFERIKHFSWDTMASRLEAFLTSQAQAHASALSG